jgi:hypothetical protein
MPGGTSETNDDVVEVAVLLRDRRLNTELLFPGRTCVLCSKEWISLKEDASEA